MTAPQLVFASAAVAVVVAVGLVVAGVAMLAGAGWALVAAGGLGGPSAVAGAVALLRDDSPKPQDVGNP